MRYLYAKELPNFIKFHFAFKDFCYNYEKSDTKEKDVPSRNN